MFWQPLLQGRTEPIEFSPAPEVAFELGEVSCKSTFASEISFVSLFNVPFANPLNGVPPFPKELAKFSPTFIGFARAGEDVSDESSKESPAHKRHEIAERHRFYYLLAGMMFGSVAYLFLKQIIRESL
jgi:hypothetical protein